MKFRFPIVIIDEDFRSENSSGLGIRALADAIESEGFQVLGVTSYGDLSQFAQQQSRASAFVLSIDDEEFSPGPDLDPVVTNLRNFIEEVRWKNADVPIYIYGETKTSRHLPTTSCANCTASSTPSRTRPSSSPATSSARPSPIWKASSRPFSARFWITPRTGPIPGTAPAIRGASRS